MEVDDNACEYATLTCQTPGVAHSTTVHVKVTFFDSQQTTVFRAIAVVVDNGAAVDSSGVYEGCVLREQAAVASCRRINAKTETEVDDDDEKVQVWLRDARAALFGRGDHAADAEYVHSLQLGPSSGNDLQPSGPLLRLLWKMKLHPIGMMVLGSVQLSRVTAGKVPEQSQVSLGLASSMFIKPLIECLLEGNKQHQRSEYEAAANAKQLLEDNQRLLDRLQSLADSRQQDDNRLIARFVEVLNAKKRQIVLLKQQLSELKQQQPCIGSTTVIDTKVRETTVQQLGRGLGKQRKSTYKTMMYDGQLNKDDSMTMKKKRLRKMLSSSNTCSSISFEEEQKVDDVDTVLQNNDGKLLHRLDENMEIDDKSSAHIVNVDHVTCDGYLETAIGSPSVVDVFDADTQIDYPDNDDKQPQQLELIDLDHKSSTAISNVKNVDPCAIALERTIKSQKSVDYFNTDPPSDCPVNPLMNDASSNDSPPWFQHTQVLQKSPNKNIGHQQPKTKNVLDDLWSGIL